MKPGRSASIDFSAEVIENVPETKHHGDGGDGGNPDGSVEISVDFSNKDGSGGARQMDAAEAKANADIITANATIYNTFTALAAKAPNESTRIRLQAKADAAMELMTN